MSCQLSVDSFGIHLLGFKCSLWHLRHANDTVASELSIFSKKHDYKSSLCIAVNPLVPIFLDLHVHGGRKLQTDRQTDRHTHGTTTVTLAVHARQGLIMQCSRYRNRSLWVLVKEWIKF